MTENEDSFIAELAAELVEVVGDAVPVVRLGRRGLRVPTAAVVVVHELEVVCQRREILGEIPVVGGRSPDERIDPRPAPHTRS
jgi:hypothetical protein